VRHVAGHGEGCGDPESGDPEDRALVVRRGQGFWVRRGQRRSRGQGSWVRVEEDGALVRALRWMVVSWMIGDGKTRSLQRRGLA
jgi:hypothetical protein